MTWSEADTLMRDGGVARRSSWSNTKAGLFLNPSHITIPCMIGFRNKLPNTLVTVEDVYWKLDGTLAPYTPTADDKAATDWEEITTLTCS